MQSNDIPHITFVPGRSKFTNNFIFFVNYCITTFAKYWTPRTLASYTICV